MEMDDQSTSCLRKRVAAMAAAAFVVMTGCQQRNPDEASTRQEPKLESPVQTSGQEPVPTAQMQQETQDRVALNDPRRETAVNAKDALLEKLSGRLKEVLQSKGPSAAIEVCSTEAVKIAEEVGSQHGVAIGRTSFKLRNPTNAPREWIKPFVDQRADTPQHVALADGGLGALFPIRLDVKCLMCHGQPDEILDDVKPKLAEKYPSDQATGFKQGDLRGWFWVEVPAE